MEGADINPSGDMQLPVHKRLPLKTLFVMLAIVVGILIIGGLALYSTTNIFRFGQTSLPVTGKPVAVPHGVILLSLVTPQASSSAAVTRPAVYDFSNSQGTFLPVDQIGGHHIVSSEQYRFSSDGQWGTFLAEMPISTSTNGAPQVYRVDVSKASDLTAVVSALPNAVALTNDTDSKRAPVISTAGDVLYMAMPVTAGSANTPEASNIMYVPMSGTPSVLTQGSYPQWVDANRFIFLKSDGIYLYSIDTGVSKRIWSIKDGGITASSMLRLSDDKSIIAWSIPQYGVVTILRVADWKSPGIQFVGTVPVVGAWPVIAHDAQAFAVLTEAPAAAGKVPLLQISVYDVATLSLLYAIPLPSADAMLSSMTDWRL